MRIFVSESLNCSPMARAACSETDTWDISSSCIKCLISVTNLEHVLCRVSWEQKNYRIITYTNSYLHGWIVYILFRYLGYADDLPFLLTVLPTGPLRTNGIWWEFRVSSKPTFPSTHYNETVPLERLIFTLRLPNPGLVLLVFCIYLTFPFVRFSSVCIRAKTLPVSLAVASNQDRRCRRRKVSEYLTRVP